MPIKEARTALLALRCASRNRALRGCKVLGIGDNLSEICATEKGRSSKDPRLRRLLLGACALTMTSRIRWCRRYVEADRNPSDADSRRWDKTVPKQFRRPPGLALPSSAASTPWTSSSAISGIFLCLGPGAADLRDRLLRLGVTASAPISDHGSEGAGWKVMLDIESLVLSGRVWGIHLELPRKQPTDPTSNRFHPLVPGFRRLFRAMVKTQIVGSISGKTDSSWWSWGPIRSWSAFSGAEKLRTNPIHSQWAQ